jgi:signal transduction histidine kinase
VAEPSAAMFGGIRRRLTLWYTGVLAAILIVSGILLYVGMQQVLIGPIDGRLAASAQHVAAEWREHTDLPCPPLGTVSQDAPYLACIDASGNNALVNRPASVLPNFVTPAIAQAARTSPSGSVVDTISGGDGFGAVRRYALVVSDPSGSGILGVVLVGVPIQGQLAALQTLATLLLLFGILTLLGAGLGGLFLSQRALAPAHLAFARQQAFIADAAHELRTPLTLLRADAEVLLRGRQRLDPEDAALLEDIVTETAHMGTLATNMLTLARLDAGDARLERDVVDLGDIAEQIGRRARALADEKRVALTVTREGTALVVGDRVLLEQAGLILLDNAIKYNREGGAVEVRAHVAEKRAYLTIQDTGAGIPPEHLPRLGERFYRVDKARSREAGGAGLGLSIARGIAVAHMGTLALTSDPGEGTTATLALPAAEAVS